MKGFFLCGLCLSPAVFYAQESIAKDSLKETAIEAVHFTKKLPVTSEVISVKKDLKNRILGQNLPTLLEQQTAMVSTSDDGNGVGYTAMRIRGVDGSRINVMLNNVPYNDSESQGTFFVNMADLAASASQIVIQRGVGTSTNGAAAFGASVNILTAEPEDKASFLTQHSYGSFNSRRNTFEVNTGTFLDGKLSFKARYSMINSDGYIERASSKLNSYSVTGMYRTDKRKIKLWLFGGEEKTYHAWNGITPQQYIKNRRYNPSGEIFDANWNVVGFYDNETDNYNQTHLHLSWEERFSPRVKLNTTAHYTMGEGYYENFKQNDKVSKYGLSPITIGGTSFNRLDFIRKKWLDNDFYGIVSDLNVDLENMLINIGLVGNQYYGKHFGQVFNSNISTDPNYVHEYYRNNGLKNEFASYLKAVWKIHHFELFGDVQYRNIHYTVTPVHGVASEIVDFDNHYSFFNPKAGISYLFNGGKAYFSYAQANREPKRSDLVESDKVRPEKLHDFELGIGKQFGKFGLDINGYYMLYKDQLVVTGKLNDVGSALQENVPNSYRMGVEVSANAQLTSFFGIHGNIALSKNKIRNYQFYDVYTQTTVDKGDTQIAFSPDIVTSLSVNFKPFDRLLLSFVNKYVGAQYVDNTQEDAMRLGAYNVSNIIAGYDLNLKNTDITLHLNVNNIFNRMYVNNGYTLRDPKYFPTPVAGLYPQAGINFLLGFTLRIK